MANQISVAVQNAQLHKALIKQREMEHELQFARQVMQSLLPERPARGSRLRFLGVLRAGPPRRRRLLRDHSDLGRRFPAHAADAARWAIAVGDVVGKGMPAALLTAKLSAEVRMFLRGDPDPGAGRRAAQSPV